MSKDYYVGGEWNACCDRCGFIYKSSELKKTWDGLMVCEKDWEPRHPQEFVKGTKDKQAVPWSKDEQPDTFTSVAQTLVPKT
jgi:hypothetical protein